jgi:hypothetical protein
VGRINQAAQAKMLRDFAKAQENGHHCDNLIAVKVGPAASAWCCVCTCGWSSTPRRRKLVAASAGYVHVLDAANGVVPPCENFTGEIPLDNLGGGASLYQGGGKVRSRSRVSVTEIVAGSE